MATTPEQCVNYELNIEMCPYINDPLYMDEEWEYKGICCECLLAHRAQGTHSPCMSGAKRDPATMNLNEKAAKDCPQNRARNQETCACASVTCANYGICCNCVRVHFKIDGSARVACMKG